MARSMTMDIGGGRDSARLPKDSATVLLDPESQPRFVNPLPVPEVIDASRPAGYVLQMRQNDQWLGLVDTSGQPLETTIWGYGLPGQDATYPGPTIVAYEGTPIRVNWQNKIPVGDHLLPVDTSIHLATSVRKPLEDGYIPVVPHLHGGHTEWQSDGLPQAWFTQNHADKGPDHASRIFNYANDQDAATLWYHDHALGLTRLNVYAGLAGFYLLRDENELGLVQTGVLPGSAYEYGMAIQDRAFTADGQLYYPAFADDPLPGTGETVRDVLPPDYEALGGTYPSIVPEFFGDFILVNGMAWPTLEVAPADYRFRLLNGSDSRFYVLQLDDPSVSVTLIGSDGGLLPQAITMIDGDGLQELGEQLVMAPGDRLDLVFGFQNASGDSVTLTNIGPAYEPFKGLTADGVLAGDAVGATRDDPVGEIMRFELSSGAPLDNASVAGGTILDAGFTALDPADAVRTRKLGLFEGTDEFGRIHALLGVAEDTVDINGNPVGLGPLEFHAPTTEMPLLGTKEVWEIHNFTEDAHPIHLHLVQFQVLGRQGVEFTDADADGIPDDVNGDGAIVIGGESDDIRLTDARPLSPEDQGWQDTVWVAPGEVLQIEALFDKPGEYVWHCHILSHEDHEMMRPFEVIAPEPTMLAEVPPLDAAQLLV